MFSKEFLEVFSQIVKSWQVIAAAVVIFLYLRIVSYVSRSYHRPKRKKAKKLRPEKTASAPVSAPEESEISSDSNDELGLDEA